jgi:predicted nucleotide-binding protein (sugar kinase/HSP70/actin superfamily)
MSRKVQGPALPTASGRPVVGIPRGLLYFHFQPLWATFFSHLGVEVRVSQPTDRSQLQVAQGLTRTDLCLPVKVYLAHVAQLKDRVDWLFLPRVTSITPEAFMCPKILGLTDMIRSVFPQLPRLLDPRINVKPPAPVGIAQAFAWVGRRLTDSDELITGAWRAAQAAQAEFHRRLLIYPLNEALGLWDNAFRQRRQASCAKPHYRVAVIGRPYVSFDDLLGHNLLDILNRYHIEVVTPELLPQNVKDTQHERLRKKVYWQLGKDLVSTAMYYASDPEVDGIINVATFGCGQDSFTTALVEYYVKQASAKPFLNLVFDEHGADGGLATRVEAFVDMMGQRKKTAGKSGSCQDERDRNAVAAHNSETPVRQNGMHLTIPHMGYLHLGFENVFRNLGVNIYMPPRPNKEALMLGARYSPSGACLPFKLNLGNMIQALDHGVTDIMMPGGFGPCRFGYYSVIQEQILRDLGYQFRMGSADNPDSLRDQLATVRKIAGLNSRWDSYKIFLFILYRLALADLALNQALRLRPRETEKHATDRALERSLQIIDATRRFPDLWSARRRIHQLFDAVPRERNRPVMKVGVVGEIFMVLENHANMDVEARLGEMGVEVHRGLWLSDWLNDRFRFLPFRRNQSRWALRQAAPYLYDPCGGESVKSVGKSAYFARNGIDGIVHLMPFSCMPELVAQTILARISNDFKIPILTLTYDEHTSPGAMETRLEAFVDLVKWRAGRAGRGIAPR